MTSRRIAVFGASGFVGRYVVRDLARDGAVIAACARHAASAGFLRPMGDVGQIAPFSADLRDERALAAVVAGCDAVVNLVGILYESGKQRFDLAHHRGAGQLATLAKSAGVKRFVQISALSADPNSSASYARSKAAGEAAVRAAFPSATILRPSLVFGPEDNFFNRFAAMARVSPVLPLIGGGATKFQPVYVGDVAAAVSAALSRDDAEGKTYALAGPAIFSLRQLFEMILQVTARKRLLMSVPFGVASLEACVLEWLPNPLLTRDQVRMLRHDSVATSGMPGLAELGITPTALELILPTYLDRFRRFGRFKPSPI
ncbi:MAG TPA: complex I NDUFA9 subunit family protein [Stellaceae bacterium]|jgi:NADH dehydrogenase|nr:complex I NDUFA9 subunit family protein [Stellaceae bacterium]